MCGPPALAIQSATAIYNVCTLRDGGFNGVAKIFFSSVAFAVRFCTHIEQLNNECIDR